MGQFFFSDSEDDEVRDNLPSGNQSPKMSSKESLTLEQKLFSFKKSRDRYIQRKNKNKGVFDKLPFDCIGVVISFLESHVHVMSLFLSCKEIYNYFRYTAQTFPNSINYILKKSYQTFREPKYFVHRLKLEEDVKISKSFKNFFPNLSRLSINDNNLMTDKELSIFGNKNDFPHLKSLSISGCENVKGERLEVLKNLKNFKIVCSEIVDYSINLPTLEYLYISYCNNLEGKIHPNNKLDELVVVSNETMTDAILLRCPNIRKLTIQECPKIYGEEIKALKMLEVLSLAFVDFQESCLFPVCPQLKKIYISGCEHFRGDCFNHLKNVEKVEISYLDNIRGENLKGLKKVKRFITSNCKILAFSLSHLKDSLKYLELDNSVSIDGLMCGRLEKLDKLEELIIIDGSVTSVNIPSLKKLRIRGSRYITDSTFLFCKNLEILNLSGCSMIKGKTLHKLDDLQSLSIENCNALVNTKLFQAKKLKSVSIKKCEKFRFTARDLSSNNFSANWIANSGTALFTKD